MAFGMSTTIITSSTAMTTRKIMESFALMESAMTSATMSVTGARVNIMSIIWKAFCTLLTSVVMRVTRPAVEKRSMLENENVWMFLNMSSRRLQAKPVLARALCCPALTPQTAASSAMTSICAPMTATRRMSPTAMPSSMMAAVL